MDNCKVTALTLLDLSAVFDAIDHSTLLERLHVHFGMSGTVFQWFKSYISNRQQHVHIDGSPSCPQDLHFGVPQGSVLGPLLFCLYTTSISQMINTHDVSHLIYADDTQVYIELSQSVTHESISSLSDCVTDISPLADPEGGLQGLQGLQPPPPLNFQKKNIVVIRVALVI